jgi:hypothetical protein
MVAVGFNPRVAWSPSPCVAERRFNGSFGGFRCRSPAPYASGLSGHRGPKPTATVKPSLRDGPAGTLSGPAGTQHVAPGVSRRIVPSDGRRPPSCDGGYGAAWLAGEGSATNVWRCVQLLGTGGLSFSADETDRVRPVIHSHINDGHTVSHPKPVRVSPLAPDQRTGGSGIV